MRIVNKTSLKRGVNTVSLPTGANVIGFDYLDMVYEYEADQEGTTINRVFEVVRAGDKSKLVDRPNSQAGWCFAGLATASNALPCVVYEYFQLL